MKKFRDKFKKNFRQIYRNILKILPAKIVIQIETLRGYKKFVNLKNPKYFGEKIQWMKIYGNLEQYGDLVDKYKVREKIKKDIGEEYLIPLIGVYDSPDDIDFDLLPNKFVLKVNHGSGYNIICKDKSKLNIENTKMKLNKWLSEDYAEIKKEYQYKNIKRKIICEEFVNDENGQLLDYKFFCFNGKAEFIKVDIDRFDEHAVNIYDLDWNLLPMKVGDMPNSNRDIKKPDSLQEMIMIANKLATGFNFVRIDLYSIDNKVYFGEITLTSYGGLTPFYPLEKDLHYANKIHLKNNYLNECKKKNVLLLSSTSYKKGRLDGVTIKSRILEDYLKSNNKINLFSIDTDNYRKEIINIIYYFFKYYIKADKIIICASSPGASIMLKFLKKIKCRKDIYYFVAGGVLVDKIVEGKYSVNLYENIERIYVESEYMVSGFKKLGIENVEKLNNFRHIEPFENKYSYNSEVKFVYYGRVVKEKGVEHAIYLINRLHRDGYKVSLDIYGQCKSEYKEYLISIINSNIKICNPIKPNNKNEYEILSKYDVFIFPTEHDGEGLPGALIDAYISGLAIIASNWAYAHEYIDNNKNGYIFEYKNYEDMYIKTKLLIESDKIKEFKEQSYEKSKEFLVEQVLDSFAKELIK